MPANTSPDNIVYPLSSDPIAPLNTAFQDLAESVQDALDANANLRAVYQYRWANAAARAAQTGMRAGDIGYQVDNQIYYRYSGSAWRAWQRQQDTYVPTLTNATRLSGSLQYSISQGIVHINGSLALSAVTGGPITLTVPTGLNIVDSVIRAIGVAGFEDVGTTLYLGVATVSDSTTISLWPYSVTGSIIVIGATASTFPFTWASGDKISVACSYPTTA